MKLNPLPPSPFVGLRPFDTPESLLFFGRHAQTIKLMQHLNRTRLLFVVGSSGCGKSSLIRAGLIPKLQAGFLAGGHDKWLIVKMKPGETPFDNLSSALLGHLGGELEPERVMTFSREIRGEGVSAIEKALAPLLDKTDTNFLLLVDQFEEIFRFGMGASEVARRNEASDFVLTILNLARSRSLPTYVITTMRSDFLADCDAIRGLPEAINQSQYLVPRLTREQLKEAIEKPINLYGQEIAPRLLERVLNDMSEGADQLPVMQHALMRTWEKWAETKEGPVDLEHYEDENVGTIKQALSLDAERALSEVGPENANLAKQIFQILTEVDAKGRMVRRQANLSEIEALTGATRKTILEVIKHFQEKNRSFLMVAEDKVSDDALIDISHESLIREWDRLKQAVEEEAQSRSMYRRLHDSAKGHAFKQEGLWRNPILRRALKMKKTYRWNELWAKRHYPESNFPGAMNFLSQSRQWQWLRWVGFSLFYLLVIFFTSIQGIRMRREQQMAAQAAFEGEQQSQLRAEAERLRIEKEAQLESAIRAMELALDLQKENELKSELTIKVAEEKRILESKARQEAERRSRELADALAREQELREENQQQEETINTQQETLKELLKPEGVVNSPIVGNVRWRRTDQGFELLDNWVENNIVSVQIPALVGKPVYPNRTSDGNVLFFKGAIPQLKAALDEIRDKGLMDRIQSWDATYINSPLMAKHRPEPNEHNFAIAFDINVKALRSEFAQRTLTAMQDIAEIFEKHGFSWDGRKNPSPSAATHFEIIRLQ